jgi:hypothetical protein
VAVAVSAGSGDSLDPPDSHFLPSALTARGKFPRLCLPALQSLSHHPQPKWPLSPPSSASSPPPWTQSSSWRPLVRGSLPPLPRLPISTQPCTAELRYLRGHQAGWSGRTQPLAGLPLMDGPPLHGQWTRLVPRGLQGRRHAYLTGALFCRWIDRVKSRVTAIPLLSLSFPPPRTD